MYGVCAFVPRRYGCLNRDCCHLFADAVREYSIFAQIVIAMIIGIKCLNLALMWWFQSHIDEADRTREADQTAQEQLHHHRHRKHVVVLTLLIVLVAIALLLVLELTIFELRECGENRVVYGNLYATVMQQDEDLGAALGDGAARGGAAAMLLARNKTAVDREYGRCAAAMGLNDTYSADPPFVELVQVQQRFGESGIRFRRGKKRSRFESSHPLRPRKESWHPLCPRTGTAAGGQLTVLCHEALSRVPIAPARDHPPARCPGSSARPTARRATAGSRKRRAATFLASRRTPRSRAPRPPATARASALRSAPTVPPASCAATPPRGPPAPRQTTSPEMSPTSRCRTACASATVRRSQSATTR